MIDGGGGRSVAVGYLLEFLDVSSMVMEGTSNEGTLQILMLGIGRSLEGIFEAMGAV